MAVDLAEVHLWGTVIAVITWDNSRQVCQFQYTPEFLNFGIEVAPLTMPLQEAPYSFPSLNKETFKGLPGMLADCLPDKFGTALINQWLLRQRRAPSSFTPLERLCYTGTRSMGALEFSPAPMKSDKKSEQAPLEIQTLVELASEVLNERNYEMIGVGLGNDELSRIFQVGTSAGGARAKAIINWNENTGEIRPGHVAPAKGFDSWLIKFDGVSGNKDKELNDPQGFGRIEYAYHLLAKAVGLKMSECRLIEEGGRAHFITKRFDRHDGRKIHKTSLCGIAHLDFNDNLANSYEDALYTAKKIGVPREDMEQLVRLMVFNVVFRNQDDHTKNIEFLMNRAGEWFLAPAFDLTFSYNPGGEWTRQHQMSINSKRDDFLVEDLLVTARVSGLSLRKIKGIITDVMVGQKAWPAVSHEAGVASNKALWIEGFFRHIA
ncbi:MAG: type II toxin-antitoxin system HipA family toxin [Cycloclasticus sp.]